MDLKGAKIVNFYSVGQDINSGDNNSIVARSIKIPHYQRPFSWGEDMVEKLILDWHHQNEKDYFAGSIVTVADREKDAHELIDGQQRFTTIFLTNYVRFLVLRVTLRLAINKSKNTHLLNLLKELSQAGKYLIKDFEDSLNIEALTTEIDKIDGDEGVDREVARENLLENYLDKVFLPTLSEDDAGFLKKHEELLEEMIGKSNVLLEYDRKSFNANISKALTRIVIKLSDQSRPAIYINEEGLCEIERQYTSAIRKIFDTFMELYDSNNSYDAAKLVGEKIGDFLKEIKVCVVQTGNSNDAYTLFEVLNDRSLALSDLDLIKNQFYKNYCLRSGDDSDVIDNNIGNLENTWGDDIYGSLPTYRKKYVTFFATCFLSGNESLGYNQNDKYRGCIKKYLENFEDYTSENVLLDFNIFRCCRALVETFDLRDREKDKNALLAQYDMSKSPVFKVVSLLSALNYDGVISGIFCLIINCIKHKVSSNFAPADVENFLKELVQRQTQNNYKDIIDAINKEAITIGNLALLHPDFRASKDLSNNLIKYNNKNSITDVYFNNFNAFSDNSKLEFFNWLDRWQYRSSDIKVKMLFAKLIAATLDGNSGNRLIITQAYTAFSQDTVAKLHLDHMEPQKVQEGSNNYFCNDSREYYVNCIGNMFPLPADINIGKSNSPFFQSFDSLTRSGLGTHWLTTMTKDIFDKNNKNNVPNVDFFTKRRDELKERFYEVLSLNGAW